jgi:hypothetical protein
MEFVYALGAGLPVFIMGIAFFRNRINFIKKGNRTIATVVKLEELIDDEDDKSYIPYFSFTTYNNREIIHEHNSTQWKSMWKLGEQVKVVYKEIYFNNYEILLLTFSNAFGIATALLSVGIELLIIAGRIYWNASDTTTSWLIPFSVILSILGAYLWSTRFFKRLE